MLVRGLLVQFRYQSRHEIHFQPRYEIHFPEEWFWQLKQHWPLERPERWVENLFGVHRKDTVVHLLPRTREELVLEQVLSLKLWLAER